VTVVTNARAFYTTRAAAGALSARHSPRPLYERAERAGQPSRKTCGEIAKLCFATHQPSSPESGRFKYSRAVKMQSQPETRPARRDARQPLASKASLQTPLTRLQLVECRAEPRRRRLRFATTEFIHALLQPLQRAPKSESDRRRRPLTELNRAGTNQAQPLAQTVSAEDDIICGASRLTRQMLARSMRLLRSFATGRRDDEYVPCGRSDGRPAKDSPRCDHHLLSTCCIPLHPGVARLLIPAADFADADEAISLRLVERRKPR
jgi:hypothetical protein